MRPGVLTTEFWTAQITAVYLILNATGALSSIPPVWATVATAIIQAAYLFSRGVAKQHQADQGRGLFGLGR